MVKQAAAQYSKDMVDDTDNDTASISANESENWFEDSISTLTYNRNQRVWSIIVTLFGDLARAPGDQISGALLSRITEPMTIKPEAMRVALHRLRNDGWIASEKSGRASLYHLTEHGIAQSAAASPLIYARRVTYPETWRLSIPEPVRKPQREGQESGMRRAGYVVVAPGVYLGGHPEGKAATKMPDCLGISGDLSDVPDWLKARIASKESQDAYHDLEQALDRFAVLLDGAPTPLPEQVATLRTIIVHIWRRALFSHPDLPRGFFPDGWRGFSCREKVMDTLGQLGQPDLSVLEN